MGEQPCGVGEKGDPPFLWQPRPDSLFLLPKPQASPQMATAAANKHSNKKAVGLSRRLVGAGCKQRPAVTLVGAAGS